ncbi:peptidoglycan DD-metalloendopeptidase family protein [Streptomyces albidus (ex Kaewkla and Franco 2022)]|uniref:peptidoglycan DD-metalloendopeptidase family protein n=1 Tax=Streptomyces albidus (ex Kaewkla and Franco 2022) TaxID=722709 RepID=UPI0028154633|nr:peptidoglycan DD-metalloendopeptidase family protein [Streptomyces albidus (ex Kaewkla and Franco 2022)]
MNESHPSGSPFPSDTSHGFSYPATHDGGPYEQSAFDSYAQQGAQQGYSHAYDGYSTGGYDNFASYGDTSYGDGDPLFGSMPGTDHGSYPTGGYDAYAGQGTYGDGGYDTGTSWAQPGFPVTAEAPAQPGAEQADYGYATGQWDGSQWETGQWDASQWNSGQWETGQWDSPAADGSWGTAGHDAAGHAPEADHSVAAHDAYAYGYDDAAQGYEAPGHYDEAYESYDGHEPVAAEGYGAYEQPASYDEPFAHEGGLDATAAFPSFPGVDAEAPAPVAHDEPVEAHGFVDARHEVTPDITPVGGPPHLRSRRRSPRPRRSALLTIAAPSVAVMGVAGAAAASVVGNGQDADTTTTQASAADTGVKPANSKLDTQLAGLSADADDFADRASRTQERIDLKERQEAERARKAKEAARKEALRPKFALPVKEHGLSAQFGQAGLNWMSVHTGIDFPVDEGTPVMAATDGTVTTKYDMSFGNMAVVTAPDGTETWYCHLSSTKIRSGEVKAGDTIGYSGSSGNSTGPHLHFEVHPGGGEAIDPLPWLRSKGLDPS